MMKNIKLLKKNYPWVAFATLYEHSLLNLKRFYVFTCIDSINAILLLAVFYIIGTGYSSIYNSDQIFVIGLGLWVLTILIRTYFGAAHSLMHYKLERVLENYVMSPLPAWLWLFTIIVEAIQGAILAGLPVIILLLYLGLPLPSLPSLLLASLLLLSIMIFLCCIGFLLMLTAQRWNDLSKWDQTLIYPLFMLSGSFFDSTVLPAEYRFVMDWNPFYQLQYGLRQLWFLNENPIAHVYIVLPAMAVVSFIITWFVLYRGYGLKH